MSSSTDAKKQLWQACKEKNIHKAESLLSQGSISTEQLNSEHGCEGTTALIEATRNKHYVLVELLLKHGADVDKVDSRNGISPLYEAISKNDADVATLLLENKANVNHQNHQGQATCCHIATSEGFVDMLRLLLKYKPDVNLSNSRQHTALHWAVVYEKYEIAELLIKHGADVNAKNSKGKSPLDTAKDKRMLDILNNTKQDTDTHPTFFLEKETDSLSTLQLPTDNSDTCDETDSNVSSPSVDSNSQNQYSPKADANTNIASGLEEKSRTLPTTLRTQHSEGSLRNDSVTKPLSKFRPISEPITFYPTFSSEEPKLIKLCDEIYEYIRKRYLELKTELSPQQHVDYLFSKDVISLVEKDEIQNATPSCKATEKLLDKLLHRPREQWTITLMESFSTITATKYMSDRFGIKAQDTDDRSSQLEKDIKENVKKYYQELIKGIPAETHINFLYSKSILSEEERENIVGLQTESSKVRKLLDTIYPKPPFLWAKRFIESLEEDEGTQHFVERLKQPVH